MPAIFRCLIFALLLCPPGFAQSPTARLDINTATAQQLQTLPGVTPYMAQRIIAARPYKQKLDLLRRGVLTQPQYEAVTNFVVAHRIKP